MIAATPASVHLPLSNFVFNCIENTYVDPLCCVLYTGQRYVACSYFSITAGRTLITGRALNISRGLLGSSVACAALQAAPSKYIPMMYVPSFAAVVTSSTDAFLVTSVTRDNLSSSSPWLCAVACVTAEKCSGKYSENAVEKWCLDMEKVENTVERVQQLENLTN